MLKSIFLPVALIAFVVSSHAQTDNNNIVFSETYELANVILALTPYGISDPLEVQKGTPYYEEVMAHFKGMKTHPLLEKVNYSRERWAEYLSFRTDAFAFEIGADGVIRRSFPFYANQGQKPFDDHLALVQDFYKKSGFHDFYQSHQPYYDGIVRRYRSYFMMDEMRRFLEEEFGVFQQNEKNLVVLSPLVNRMNCHRNLDKTTSADFATLAISLIAPDENSGTDDAQQASDIHMLFTEMNHGYVNPVSRQHAKLIARNFKYKLWDNKSGYTHADCFNEYMTWAVYDLFVWQYFPQHAAQTTRDWHLQNNNRGFIASSLFGKKLRELYEARQKGQAVRDLYPALLEWTASVQKTLRMPVLAADSMVISAVHAAEAFEIPFTEPLKKLPMIDCGLFKVENGERKIIRHLTLEEGKNLFFKGKTLRVAVPGGIPPEPGLYGLNFNTWGWKHELTSESGVSLKCPSRFYIRIKAPTTQELCMQNVIALDDSLGRLRNHACERISMSETIKNYVSALESIPFNGCPANFADGFKQHCAAWLALLPFTDRHPELRGEMHVLFKQLETGHDGEAFKAGVKKVWDTWDLVEKAWR
ncbi:MAG: DUF4932 domain-containing protein [Saprospiraceae bacterium]|nr:DUF4932 domain-containing protein [Saprospiraceae bacterium]